MTERAFLGEFEQMVLLAVLQLDDAAHGPSISAELEARAGRQVSRGALYATLDRLERKGLLRWEIEAATSASIGNRRRRFEVTAQGVDELVAARDAFRNLWDGLEHLGTGPRGRRSRA